MVNRKGFTVVQLLIAAVVVGLLLILLVAVPNVMRQTRNSSRAQDVHILGLLINEQRVASGRGSLPTSCSSIQTTCFIHNSALSFYDVASTTDAAVEYYRSSEPFGDESLRLNILDDDVTHKVLIHTYARCDDGQLSGELANSGTIAIQYAVETMRGVKLVCKNI